MRVRLSEAGIRPQVYFATGWDLNFGPPKLGASIAAGRFWVYPVPIPRTRLLTKRTARLDVGEETANS